MTTKTIAPQSRLLISRGRMAAVGLLILPLLTGCLNENPYAQSPNELEVRNSAARLTEGAISAAEEREEETRRKPRFGTFCYASPRGEPDPTRAIKKLIDETNTEYGTGGGDGC